MAIGAIGYQPGRSKVVDYLVPFGTAARNVALLSHKPGFGPMWHSIVLPFQRSGMPSTALIVITSLSLSDGAIIKVLPNVSPWNLYIQEGQLKISIYILITFL